METVFIPATEVASQIGVDMPSFREYAKRKTDPLPIRYLPGRRRYGFFIVSEIEEWMLRNTDLYAERDS